MLQSTQTLQWIHERHTSARCSAKKASSPIGTEALEFIFSGTETDTVLSVCIISAPHPSMSCCSLAASKRPVTACSTSPSACVWRAAAAAQQFTSDCFPFSPQRVHARTQSRWLSGTHTNTGTQRQEESQNTYTSVEATRHEAIFHCYYDQTQRAECSHTTDLNSRPPFGKEQVCVAVWYCLLLHVCFSTGARTCPSTLDSSTAQVFLLTGITANVSVSSSMMAPVNYAPHKNLTLTRLVLLQVNAMSQKCGLIGRQCEWQELQGILRQLLRTRTLYIEHGWGLHFFRWSAHEEEACLEITEQIPFNTWIFVFKNQKWHFFLPGIWNISTTRESILPFT